MATRKMQSVMHINHGTRIALVVLVLVLGAPLFAQDASTEPNCQAGQRGEKPLSLYDWAFCSAAVMVDQKLTNQEPSISEFFDPMAVLALADGLNPQKKIEVANLKRTLVTAEQETKRTDRQLGASARAEGSTTLAEKTGIEDLLGLAIENGAIQKEVNGTTLTLSTSPYVLSTLRNGDTASNYLKHGNDLGRVGIAATFNIANQQDILSNATRKQLAEWGVRIRLSRDHSSRSEGFETFWSKNVKAKIEQQAIVITLGAAAAFQSNVAVEARRRQVHDELAAQVKSFFDQQKENLASNKAQSIAQLRDKILATLRAEITDNIDSFGLDPATKEKVAKIVSIPALTDAHVQAGEAAKDLNIELQRLQRLGTATFEYTNVRDTTSGTYSNLKFLYEKGSSDTMKVVFNIGGSFYSDPTRELNQQTTRDFATALSWEGIAGRSPLALDANDQSQVTFSFSGRYQRLLENRHVPGKKADIASAQGKLELPILTGASLALSITYANADELVSKDHVRFNFGVNYDTGKLYQLLQVNKQKAALMR